MAIRANEKEEMGVGSFEVQKLLKERKKTRLVGALRERGVKKLFFFCVEKELKSSIGLFCFLIWGIWFLVSQGCTPLVFVLHFY